MTTLRSFSVQGLAGREGAVEVDLNDNVNVFFGLNGSGKTSLLRILHSALQDDPTALLGVPFESAEVGLYSETHDQILTRKVSKSDVVKEYEAIGPRSRWQRQAMVREYRELRRLTGHQQQLFLESPILAWNTKPPSLEGRRFAHTYLPTTRLFVAGDTRSASPEDPELALDIAFQEFLLNAWRDYFGAIQAEVRDLQQQGLADILRAVLTVQHDGDASAVPPDLAYEQMVRFLKRQDPDSRAPAKRRFAEKYEDEPLLREVVRVIDATEQRIDEVMAPRNRLDEVVTKLFGDRKRVGFQATEIQVWVGDDNEIGVRSLSSGEKHALRLLLASLEAATNVVLIDEPELSLHIDWQRDLVAIMRELNPTMQIVLATHSPEIMADIDDENIFRL